jgi:hypothetical protein
MSGFEIREIFRVMEGRGGHDDDKVDMISNVFKDVEAVSPYDMVRVLAKLSRGPNVTSDLGNYVTKTMKMFRKMVRDTDFEAHQKVRCHRRYSCTSAGCVCRTLTPLHPPNFTGERLRQVDEAVQAVPHGSHVG